jgi:hypothetical protein
VLQEYCCNGNIIDDEAMGQVRCRTRVTPLACAAQPAMRARWALRRSRCSRLRSPSRAAFHQHRPLPALSRAPRHGALAQVLQFQGDQRQNIGKFIIENQLAPKDKIKTHGF